MTAWYFGEDNSCPTSTNKRKRHHGIVQSRKTVKKEYPAGSVKWRKTAFTTVSYVDHVKCEICGTEFDQEWMPSGI